MKYFSVVSVLFLLLLTGCNVEFVSRTDNSKIYASSLSCGEENEQTQADAVNELIKNYPLIAEDLKQYVKVDKTDSNGTVCYDAIVTKRGWDRYIRAFKSRQEEIIQYADKHEKIFEYNDKDILIKTMLTERRRFNSKLESAKKLAPMDIEPFLVDYKSLKESINVLPSVKIKVRPCNKNRNYNCEVAFFAETKDESQNLIYAWDFGEGSKSEKRDPTHRYQSEGSYSVSLQVTDESGLSTYRTKEILVTKSKVSQKADDKKSLKAYFILHEKSYTVNEEADFDNRSQSSDSEIVSYLWMFGDGEESTVRNPKHRYKEAGKYVVKYKMCSADNACAYASTSVKIVAESKKAKPAVKTAVVKEQKRPAIDAKAGEDIQAYIASHGQPSKKIVEKKGTTKAYKFGTVWLLVKYDKVVCAVQEEGFKTTLMGQPKKCNWHKRYAKDYMVELQ
ncbi:MAG: PKD domain-containing protein [Sulfurimonadaceae bacterium]